MPSSCRPDSIITQIKAEKTAGTCEKQLLKADQEG